MIKLEKKHIKIFSVVIAAVFVGSVVALALTQMGGLTGGTASAASSSIGVVDFNQVMGQSTDVQDANTKFQLAVQEAQNDFESKTAGMSDEEKGALYQQAQEKLMQKRQQLFEPIQKKVEAEVKSVAEAKGLSVVIAKEAVVYGGQDITQDVIRKMAK
jgi:outer membrane protein